MKPVTPSLLRLALLLALCGTTGCAGSSRRQTYIVLDRYFAENTDDRSRRPAEEILRIQTEAAKGERIIIEKRLAALDKARENMPARISTARKLLADSAVPPTLSTTQEDLIEKTAALLSKAPPELRLRVADWLEAQWPITLSAWNRHPQVLRFREELQREQETLTTRFEQGLQEALRYAQENRFSAAAQSLTESAALEPEAPALAQTADAILKAVSAAMERHADNGRYKALHDACSELLETLASRETDAASEMPVRRMSVGVARVLENYAREIAEHFIDQAEKNSSLWNRHGLAVALCDAGASLAMLQPSGSAALPRPRAEELRALLERRRPIYTARVAENARRTIRIEKIEAAAHLRPAADELRARIARKVESVLRDRAAGALRGATLEPLDATLPADPVYTVGGVLELAEASPPALTEETHATHENIYDPETLYGVRRQKSVTLHVTRKTFRQTARFRGRIVIRHGEFVETVPWDLSDRHEYTVEEEDPEQRKTRFHPTPPARKTQTYIPQVGRPVDPQNLLAALREQAVAPIVERLAERIAAYPRQLEESALAYERLSQWDRAADAWAQLSEHEQRAIKSAGGAQTESDDPSSVRQARQRGAQAALRWLAAKEGASRD
jgi:hypothetical protein